MKNYRVRCDNCGVCWDYNECPDAKNLNERLDPGTYNYTDKECPECGALVYRLPGMKVRWQWRGSHVWAVIFMGGDIDHLACVGTLTLRPDEWERMKEILSAGNKADECQLHFEEVRGG